MECPAITAWFRVESGTNQFKAGKYVVGIGIYNTLLLPCGRSRLLQRRGRVFAFKSCGPCSIPTLGGWDFSALCNIWWLSVGPRLVFRTSLSMKCPEITAWFRVDSGTNQFKAGKYVVGIGIYNTLLLPCGRSRLLQRRGRVFAFKSCSPCSIPTLGGWDFSALCNIWWLSVGPRLVFRTSLSMKCLEITAWFRVDSGTNQI